MRFTEATDRALLAVAAVIMLGGAGMLLTEVVTSGITIPLITVGIALVAVAQVDIRRRRTGGPPRRT